MMYGYRASTLLGGLLIGVSAAALVVPVPARAVETINLTAVSGYPPVAAWVKVFKDFYMPEVAKQLAKTGKYRIN